MSDWQNRIVGYGEEEPEQLLANPRNHRIHPRRQQDALKGSLDTLGYIQTVIVNRTTAHIVDGHLRVVMAMREGQKSIPVTYVELTPEEEAQALLSLDPIAAMAANDKDKVDELLRMVNTDNADVMKHLADFAAENKLDWGQPEQVDAEPQIDRAAELQKLWGTSLGQLWKLGEHRLLVGDCTVRENVERLMGGEVGALFETDPPYGVDYVEKARYMDALGYGHSQAATQTDIEGDGGLDAVDLFKRTLDTWKPFIQKCAFYVWHSDRYRVEFEQLLKDLGVHIHETIIWVKPNFVISRMDYHPKHEPCLYGWIEAHTFSGERNQTTLWEIGRENDKIHPTQKPIEVFEIPMKNNTATGDICIEPFAGSGSQIIAAHNLNRRCYACEISPAYSAVILQRFVDATGIQPELVN